MTKPLTDEQYLHLFKINENKYLIGIYQDGITIYKQQIRALNIFHALYKTKLKDMLGDKNFKIGIIGGGIAGLTFAAAALEAGFKVILFERQSIYLHMQFGCDIRKIHPNLYEWPDKNYVNPYAELPLLDWKHDSASNVVKQIIRGWEKIRAKAKVKDVKGNKIFESFMSCKSIEISEEDVKSKKRFRIAYNGNVTATEFCDMLVYATGYGIERGVEEKADTPSYWRNDYYSQIELHTVQPRYIISGVGDGGLIDLFRLKIFDFSYDLVLNIIENHPDYKDLNIKLTDIKDLIRNTEVPAPDILYTQFSNIHEDFYKYIFEEFRTRGVFTSTRIVLNDINPDFENTLDHKKISFLHAFLIFILMRNGNSIGLVYKGGELIWDKASKTYTLNGIRIRETDKVIIRHGTKREASLPLEYLNDPGDVTLAEIKKRQEEYYNHGNVERRWSNAELWGIFNPSGSRNFEYLNPNTSILCTNYIAGLSHLVKNYFKVKKNFRISLYRVIFVQGNYLFQQITSYFGTQPSTRNESIGQVFKIDRGNVGLSFTTGRPTLIRYRNDADFAKLIANLDLSAELEDIKKNKSFFTLPILSRVNDEKELAANLVLYVESPEEDFFEPCTERSGLIDLICSASAGFIEAINHHINYHEVEMVPVDFVPKAISGDFDKSIKSNPCFEDVCIHNPELIPGDSTLVFDEWYTFNMIT